VNEFVSQFIFGNAVSILFVGFDFSVKLFDFLFQAVVFAKIGELSMAVTDAQRVEIDLRSLLTDNDDARHLSANCNHIVKDSLPFKQQCISNSYSDCLFNFFFKYTLLVIVSIEILLIVAENASKNVGFFFPVADAFN
jgi:hypothetical protein